MPLRSEPRKRKSFKRTRALKRKNIRFEPINRDHLGYVWAAYQRGAFDKDGLFEKGLSAMEFSSVVTEMVTNFTSTGGEAVVAVAKTPLGEIPVALISITYENHRSHPHAVWFPEATPRLRVEIGVKFIVELKKNTLVLITSADENTGYFRHLCRYGLLRAVGKITDYYEKDRDAMMFQSAGS